MNEQSITYAAVNAHHQNGVAERRIRELQNLTRTMLIHAARRWNNCITANLWPYALRQASEIINNSPNMQNKHRKTPVEIFTKTKVSINVKHFQTFGCPTYVLDNSLQHNSPYHKWKERSRVGIYLGMSPIHGKNVALVLNRRTGLVSPQFHVKFDPYFHSVEQDTYDSQWQHKAGFAHKTKQTKENLKNNKNKNVNKRKQPPDDNDHQEPQIPPEEGRIQNSEGEQLPMQNNSSSQQQGQENQEKTSKELQHKSMNPSSAKESHKRLKTLNIPRETRNSLKTQYGSTGKVKPIAMEATTQPINVHEPDLIQVMITEISRNTQQDVEGEILCLEALHLDHEQQHHNMMMENDPLYAFKATTDPDTMYMHEAMREPDWKEFQKAISKEVHDQMENGNFSIIKRSKVPKGKIILPAVWQMKRKRDIKTRKVKKYKAH